MNKPLRYVCTAAIALLLLGTGALVGQEKFGKPKSIVHVVTLYWKPGTSAEMKKQALDGVAVMASKIPGITNVWLKSVKVQGDADGKTLESAFVMEFKDQKAFDAYVDHPAHKAWEAIYLKVRGESRTHDITNE